jgi:hypothetical protein
MPANTSNVGSREKKILQGIIHPFFSIGSGASYNSGTVYSLQIILFLRKLCGLTFLLQIKVIHGLIRQVMHALFHDVPASQQFLNAIRFANQFDLTLREHIIGSWRELDNLSPHDNHHSSRIMRTYHTHFGIPLCTFGVPLGIAPGWWDERKRNYKPVLPPLAYFQEF